MQTKPVKSDYIAVVWRVDSRFRRISGLTSTHERWLRREPVGIDNAISRFSLEISRSSGRTWRKMPIIPPVPTPRGPKWWADCIKAGPVVGYRCSKTKMVVLCCTVERSVWIANREESGDDNPGR